jgi:hypothetical protein
MAILRSIQEADPTTKRLLAAALTLIGAILAASIWLSYMSSLLGPRAGEGPQMDFSFWDSMKGGTAAVYDAIFTK